MDGWRSRAHVGAMYGRIHICYVSRAQYLTFLYSPLNLLYSTRTKVSRKGNQQDPNPEPILELRCRSSSEVVVDSCKPGASDYLFDSLISEFGGHLFEQTVRMHGMDG